MTQKRSIFQWFGDISISRKLNFTVGIMATLIAVELLTLWFAIHTLSSVRAYVGGEGLWSKGQKDAVYHLQKYGHSHHEADYQNFLLFMKVPLGDHLAREAMLKTPIDWEGARAGFIQGRNDPEDIDGMIRLMVRFHTEPHLKRAIDAWTEADPQIMRLLPLAEQLHQEITSDHPSQEVIDALEAEVQRTNENLTVLEDNFSFALGEGSRWLEFVILRLLFAVALTVEITGLLLAFSVSRSIQRGLKQIIRASKAIAGGDFEFKARVYSRDEIGMVAEAINHMADEIGQAENRFRRMLESAPDAMVIVNQEGKIRLVNEQAEKVFGYTRGELIGQPIEILIPDRFEASHPSRRQEYFARPQIRTMGMDLELYGRRKNGEEFPVEISLSPLETEEGLWVSSAIRDISEKKLDHLALRDYARKLEVTNNNLEQFAYVASHDLQEPLRTITNFVTMFQEKQQGKLDKDSEIYLDYIVNASERMKALIRDLLMYSRVGRHHVTESIDTAEVVNAVLQELHTSVQESGAQVTVGFLPVLRANKAELHELFLNLISNAIKYSKPGIAAQISIEARAENSHWLFAVKDNGIGIDKAYSERVFVIFQRLHNQNQYSGTGVGLATCRKIIELHGGRIWLESAPGEGTTFYFTFPT
ncbi:MAG: PAS domain S-box protein [Bacteroidetes bacterium]|nr:PAS domain S-box protein [Bacteroidota bacterium]